MKRSAPFDVSTRIAIALAIAAACLVASAAPAHAAGCTAVYDPATRVLTIDGCTHEPDAPVTAHISRTAAGAIRLDGQAIAGGPTVTNTDEIVYDGDDGESDEITLDMSNGQFRPGATPEILSTSEIEITIDGGSGATNFLTILGDATESDPIEIGAAGINVDGDADSDVSRANVGGRLLVDGQGGGDRLNGEGFAGYGPSTAPLELRGGGDNDLLTGGAGADVVAGGDGVDSVIEDGSSFTLTDASLTGNGADTLASIERATLEGNTGPDTIDASAFSGQVSLIGYGGNDTLRGAAGNDYLRGHLGDDVIDGGAGSDLITDAVPGDAVLTDGSLTGVGSDTLTSIERANLAGSAQDQTFDASAFGGLVLINAGAGADVVLGALGDDTLNGGEGPDQITGGPGVDAIDAGPGDDRTFTGDGITETVECGDGTDTAFLDDLDGASGCELLDRGGAAPVQPGDPATGGSTAPGGDPVVASAAGASGARDTVAPTLSRVTLGRRAFRAARRGAALAAAVGTPVRFTLSEPATVTFRIARVVRGGRRVRLRGALTHRGAAGANRVVLRGRLARRALRPGRYRLVVRATDAAGNRSVARSAAFRIVAG